MQKCKNAKLKIEPAPLRNQLLPGLSRMCVEHGKRKSHKVTKSKVTKSHSHRLAQTLRTSAQGVHDAHTHTSHSTRHFNQQNFMEHDLL